MQIHSQLFEILNQKLGDEVSVIIILNKKKTISLKVDSVAEETRGRTVGRPERGRRGDPCGGSSMDSHPVALAEENTTNLIRVGRVKDMCTLSGTVTDKYTPTVTHTHTQKPTHSLLIVLAKMHRLLTALAK